jgi:hypothetical protein
MNKKNLIVLATIAAIIIIWSSCNKKVQTPAVNIAPEVLTTEKLIATNANDPSDVDSAQWVQRDLTGAAPPDLSHDTLRLKANATYNVQYEVFDSSLNQTPLILARENFHLICFDIASDLNLTITRTDHDNNNPPLPIGLSDQFVTGAASADTVVITQWHQPNVKNGSCGLGAIDIQSPFYVIIK